VRTAVILDQETRKEALLIEPEGQYIVKSRPLGPDFRLYSWTRFSTFKLKLRQNGDDTDVLRCAKTGATVNLTTGRGILGCRDEQKGWQRSMHIQVCVIRADEADCRGHLAWQAVSSSGDPYVWTAESSEGLDGHQPRSVMARQWLHRRKS
jgi:hypothetical protein